MNMRLWMFKQRCCFTEMIKFNQLNAEVQGYRLLHFSYLTHWGRDKMDAISQTTFSSAFFLMKMFEFW